jgi:phage terminase Nu1 subunit (DNA packaging protein)
MSDVADLRSLAEAATFFGVSQPTVRKWIETGCPVAEKGASGVAYKLDLRAVAEWRDGERRAEEDAERLKAERDSQLRLELLGGQALTIDEGNASLSPRARADALQAEVAATKLAQLRRSLVEAEPMKLYLSEVLATLKTRLRQIPDTAAPEMGLTDAQQVRLGELIDDALNDTADALETLTADAPAPS